MHKDGRIDPDNILVLLHHGFPPIAPDIVFKFNTVLPVVIHGTQTVVNLTRLKHKPVLFGVGCKFFEKIFLVYHAAKLVILVGWQATGGSFFAGALYQIKKGAV